MSRAASVNPESITLGLAAAGMKYEGTAIFAPSPQEMARVMGVGKGLLYYGGTNYEQKLEQTTGLTVIHNGIVLGDPERVTETEPQLSHQVNEAELLLDGLSPAARLMLAQRLLGGASQV